MCDVWFVICGVWYVMSDVSNSRDDPILKGRYFFGGTILRKSHTKRHDVTAQNTRILSNTVVRTSEPAR